VLRSTSRYKGVHELFCVHCQLKQKINLIKYQCNYPMLVDTNVQLDLSVLDHVTAWQDCQRHWGRLVASFLSTSILHLLNYQQSPKLIMYSSSSIFVNSVPRYGWFAIDLLGASVHNEDCRSRITVVPRSGPHTVLMTRPRRRIILSSDRSS
jgi:hypothetical protein